VSATDAPEGSLKRLYRHSAVYALGNIANRVGSFLLLPLYTHALAVSEYGALELFYVTSNVISSFLSAGIAHATLRFYFEYETPAERHRVVSTCLMTTALYALPVLFALSLFNQPLARLIFDDVSYAGTFNIVYAILLLELMRQIGLAYFRAKEYSTRYVVVCLLQLVIQVGCNIYTVGVLKNGVKGVLIGNLAAVFVGWAYLMWVVGRECGWGFDTAKMRAILHYSYPFVFTAIVSVLVGNMDRIVIRAFFSLAEVGIYALAFKFGNLLQELLLDPYNRSFGAYRFTIMKEKDAGEILSKSYTYLVLALCGAGLGLSLFAGDALRVLSDPAYWGAARLVPVIALGFLASGSSYMFQTGILYTKRTRYTMHVTTASSLTGACLFLILIPRFGTMGAAWSVALRSAVDATLTYLIARRLYPIRYKFARPAKAVLLAALWLAVGRFLDLPSLALSLIAKVLWFGAFPVALYFAGALERADVERAKAAVGPVWRKLRSART
jgi:O-antigen/teichoic acid export membrane protein